HLVAQEDADRVLGLLGDLAELRTLLGIYPLAGRELARHEERTLRRRRLRRAPFVAWYRYAPEEEEVTLYRLFHARQRTPEPRLP
ncbi:MAG: type II toxin-antitoxin system RelE/ParE family toxin, partial [Chloroflexi bacterium]|nr:type II toxin-antitoxin system RelE/ParE family toxin [Chloroflexota bacterium]